MRRNNHDTTHHLRWFFTESAAAVSGMRSSYWTLVEMAHSGAARQAHSGASRTPTGWQLSAAGRESDIAGRLEQLAAVTIEGRVLSPAELRVILSLAFGPSPWPVVGAFEQREDRRRLGEHPGVALVSQRAQRAFLAAVTKRERRAGEDERPVLISVEGCLDDRRTSAHRAGDDPRAGVKAMIDRGLVDWLRGPTISDATLGQIRDECAGLVRAAARAWEAVAPRPDSDGRVRHDQRRRAAYGPAGQDAEEGDRQSGEVLIDAFCPAWEAEPAKAVG